MEADQESKEDGLDFEDQVQMMEQFGTNKTGFFTVLARFRELVFGQEVTRFEDADYLIAMSVIDRLKKLDVTDPEMYPPLVLRAFKQIIKDNQSLCNEETTNKLIGMIKLMCEELGIQEPAKPST